MAPSETSTCACKLRAASDLHNNMPTSLPAWHIVVQIRILQPSDQNRAPTEQLTAAWGRQRQIKNQLQEEKNELSKQNKVLAEQLAEAQEGQRQLRHQLQQAKEATRAHQANTKIPSVIANISLRGVP